MIQYNEWHDNDNNVLDAWFKTPRSDKIWLIKIGNDHGVSLLRCDNNNKILDIHHSIVGLSSSDYTLFQIMITFSICKKICVMLFSCANQNLNKNGI